MSPLALDWSPLNPCSDVLHTPFPIAVIELFVEQFPKLGETQTGMPGAGRTISRISTAAKVCYERI